jgi:hypothetical protein
MPCEIRIVSVAGTGAPGSTARSIDVTGTARDCARIIVTLTCTGTITSPPATVGTDGRWTVRFNNTSCTCGDIVEIFAECEADRDCKTTFRGVLECTETVVDPRCPDVSTPTVIYGACLPDGTRSVTFDAIITPSGSGTVIAHWNYDPSVVPHPPVSSPIFGSGSPIPAHGEYNYHSGRHTAHLVIDSPMPCGPFTVELDVPPCPPVGCPSPVLIARIRILEISGTCNPAGTRNVRLTADVSGSPARAYIWQFHDGTGDETIDPSAHPTPEITHPFPAPGLSTHTTTYPDVTLLVSSDNPLCSRSSVISVAVPGCGATVTCPEINGELTAIADACPPDPNPDPTHRGVTLDAMISAGSGVADFEWNFGDGTAPEHPTGSARIHHTYAAPGTYIAGLTVRGPAGCPESTRRLTFNVEACPPPCPPGQQRDSSGNCVPIPGGGMSIGCWVLLIIALVLAVVATVLGIVAVCLLLLYLGIVAIIIALIALVLLLLWLIFCASTACPILLALMDFVIYIVPWVLLVVGILLLIFSGLGCGLGAFGGSAVYWAIILMMLWAAARRIPCLVPVPGP